MMVLQVVTVLSKDTRPGNQTSNMFYNRDFSYQPRFKRLEQQQMTKSIKKVDSEMN